MKRAHEDDRRLVYETVDLDDFRRDPYAALGDADIRPVGLARDEPGRASHILLSRSEYASMVKARDRWMRSQLDLAEVEVATAEASD